MTRSEHSNISRMADAMFWFRLALILCVIATVVMTYDSKTIGHAQPGIETLNVAQDGSMSYAETVDWLKENINQSSRMNIRQPDVFMILASKDLKIDGCAMSWKSIADLHNGNTIVFNNNTVSLSMRDVSNVEVVTDPGMGEGLFSVVLKVPEGKKSITTAISKTFKGTQDDSRHEEKTEMRDGAGIVFDDEALARKFSKAIQVVLKHCGDK